MVIKDDILKDLNPEQKKAVTHKDEPLLVIAGAGTGKTQVIIRRIAYLINQKIAKPEEILALTFTDKAAEEMEGRVDILVPYGYIDVTIQTFHAFGDRILRDHAIDLGFSSAYRVLSRSEQMVFLREHLFELPLKHYKSLSDPIRHLDALLDAISRAQDEDVSPAEYLKKAKTKEQKEVAYVYAKYQQLKAKKGFLDFGDQVNLALKLFRERPTILKRYQEKFKYILVDEFQDTNSAQFELLKLLAGKKANLMVVGDDDQAIYRFRGAAISNILNFQKNYRNTKKIVLTQNYRSTQIILDTAQRLIRHNAGIVKSLKAHSKAKNKKVEHHHFDAVSAEADWVAQTIKKKCEAGANYSDFAILVRANKDAESFRQALNMAGIPGHFFGKTVLYSYPEIKFAISFLRAIGDPSDSIALYQLATSIVYQLDPLDLQKMNTFAKRRNYTLHHVFTHLEDGGKEFEVLKDICTESRVTVRKIMEDIKEYLAFAKERSTGEVLYQFLKKSGYLARLARKEGKESEHKLKNLADFFGQIKEFKEVVETDKVQEFVKYINILKESGENPESETVEQELDAVNILTVHRAKGLEFKIVFLVSLVAEKFPARFRREQIELPAGLIKEDASSGNIHLQEERRLFYVGMTRAKEELYLTSAADYGGKRARKVSQFVLEALDMPRVDLSVIKKSARDQIELFAPAEIAFPLSKKVNKDEKVVLSFYQIDDYLTCPLKYKYIHILRVPLLPNHQILYGAALHQAVQAYNQAKLNHQRFSEKDLHKVLLNNWSKEGFISREHEESRLNSAQKALKLFFEREKKSKRKIKFVEEDFSVSSKDLVIRGRWDRVDEQNGKDYIIDFKSSEVKSQEDANRRAKESLQLLIYTLVWKERFGKLPAQVELNFLETGLTGSAFKTDKDIKDGWAIIEKVAVGIKKQDFKPKPNYRSCSYCPYNEICPASAI